MPRPACINLPELTLQLLFRRRPGWKEHPAAVVEANKPLARITALNRPAASIGIRRGMRYATALSLASQLRAEVVSPEQLDAARQEVHRVIADFSPEVEECGFDSEIFWADTRGMLSLFDSRASWAAQLKRALAKKGLHANIAVGFSRFGTFAWAKRRKAVRVFASAEEEARVAAETPLMLLPFPPRARELTENLGLTTVGDFTQLAPADIRRRLGSVAFEIYRFATAAENLPLQGEPPEEEPTVSLAPLSPIQSIDMLETAIGRLLEELLDHLKGRGESIRELAITLRFENGGVHTERITPARPTRSVEVLRRLLHLRLEHLTPADGITHIGLEADRVEVSYRQEELFAAESGTPFGAEEKAIAALRAELGNDAVASAQLAAEYLPEEGFRFLPVDGGPATGAPATSGEAGGSPSAGAPDGGQSGRGAGRGSSTYTLVRRLRSKPLSVPKPTAGEAQGPFIVSGHWWRTERVNREYYYLHLPDGRTLWVYFDREAGRWYLQGSVD